ncbi:uncharacterized protein LOC144671611 isoform X2 [Cetorhinus maximus]
MGSSQMKLRLVLFTLTLLLSLQLSHFFSLSKVDSAVGSLTIEKSVDSPDTGSLLLREKRMSHLSVCVYCCGCCNKKGTKKTCGYCCKL